MDRLASKVVTGADRGVGLALARTLACETLAKAWDGEGVDPFDELLAEVSPAEAETMVDLMGRLVDRLEARGAS